MTDRKVQLGVGSLETMDGARVAYLTEYLVGQGWLREQAAVACADWVAGRRDKLAETSLSVLERGQRGLEPPLADVAPRARDVRPDLDLHLSSFS